MSFAKGEAGSAQVTPSLVLPEDWVSSNLVPIEKSKTAAHFREDRLLWLVTGWSYRTDEVGGCTLG